MNAKIDDFTDLDSMPDVKSFTSEALCEIIVCDRYFNSYRKFSVLCMEELAARRIDGDTFPYEKYIEASIKDYPKIETSIPDIGNVLRKLTNKLPKG